MLTSTRKNHRSSTDFGATALERGRDAAATASIQTAKLLLTFDQQVMLAGIPAGVQVNGAAPTAAAQTSPTTVLLTYATAVAAGQAWAIANKEPSLRTKTGGFVAAAGGTFPA